MNLKSRATHARIAKRSVARWPPAAADLVDELARLAASPSIPLLPSLRYPTFGLKVYVAACRSAPL
jgi:hypothetical protein